jgi:hypothetical protein
MTESTPTVVVTSDEGLPDVIARLRDAAAGGRAVNLVVPIDSSLLLTANEFRALKDAIDEHRLAVQMRTSDPLRLRLAERLGVEARTLPRTRRVVAPPPTPPSTPEPVREAVEPVPIVGPVLQPDPEALWPLRNGHAATEEEAESIPDPEAVAEAEPLLERPPRRWLPVAAGLALIVVAAFFALRFAVPRAVIHVAPKTAPVAGSLVFDVTPDGKPLDDGAAFAIAPTPQEFDVTWEGEAPVTGVRVVPDETAGGPIELRNASAEPLTVDAGTVVTTEAGAEFAFAEGVTVPAADAATGEPGAATGQVEAVKPGTGGNVDTGEIGGRLPNGVYYSNRMQPTAGGTDKEFPIVAQADLDALSKQAAAAAPDLVRAALAKNGADAVLLASSVNITGQQDAFDHHANDDAERVALKATLTIEAMTYPASAVKTRFEPALAAQLNAAAPEGYAVNSASITYEPPVETDEGAHGVRLEVAAKANAEAVLSDAERERLAAELAGKTPEEAAAILARAPQVASFTVDYEPAWLSGQMPNNAARIEFEIAE